MITLTERIQIAAPFEALSAWVDHFEEEFVRWSPYHLECQLLSGGIKAGDRIRFYEIVMGMDYDVTGTIQDAERDEDHFRFTFLSDTRTARITFSGGRAPNGCFFEHTEEFGLNLPLIGAVVNFILFQIIYRRKADWQIIRDDMIMDNRYLAEILEKGIYPARIPVEMLRKQSK